MEVIINRITGYEDAIAAMFYSKQNMTPEFFREIREAVDHCTDKNGAYLRDVLDEDDLIKLKFDGWMNKLCGWGWQHITLLKFVDISSSVYGLHRAGQDDWDAHAERYDNRIIRASSRMSEFAGFSSYYEDKVVSTDAALAELGIEIPDEIIHDGVKYVKCSNGYIREDMKDVQDVKRGLYMLGIPSSFIFKVNVTQYAHAYKERNKNGHAHPEVKECAETLADKLQEMCPWFTRDLLLKIKN